MSNTPTQGFTRRGFIRVLGTTAAAAGALGLLSACGSEATPASSSAAPASSAAAAASKPAGSVAASPAGSAAASGGAAAAKPTGNNAAYPNYFPAAGAPKADFPSTGSQYIEGFTNYPKNVQKSWTKAPPGAGSKITSY